MHDGRCTNNLLANRTSFRRTVSLNFGAADVHSSRPHPQGQFDWRVWCAIICPLRNHALLNTHICIHLEIPRCSIHRAHKIRVASLVFGNPMNCPHWFCSLWRLDNESSRSWYDPRNHSILMQRLQLALVIVVFVHHPHNLFSELHHLVAVTPFLDHVIRCLPS